MNSPSLNELRSETLPEAFARSLREHAAAGRRDGDLVFRPSPIGVHLWRYSAAKGDCEPVSTAEDLPISTEAADALSSAAREIDRLRSEAAPAGDTWDRERRWALRDQSERAWFAAAREAAESGITTRHQLMRGRFANGIQESLAEVASLSLGDRRNDSGFLWHQSSGQIVPANPRDRLLAILDGLDGELEWLPRKDGLVTALVTSDRQHVQASAVDGSATPDLGPHALRTEFLVAPSPGLSLRSPDALVTWTFGTLNHPDSWASNAPYRQSWLPEDETNRMLFDRHRDRLLTALASPHWPEHRSSWDLMYTSDPSNDPAEHGTVTAAEWRADANDALAPLIGRLGLTPQKTDGNRFLVSWAGEQCRLTAFRRRHRHDRAPITMRVEELLIHEPDRPDSALPLTAITAAHHETSAPQQLIDVADTPRQLASGIRHLATTATTHLDQWLPTLPEAGWHDRAMTHHVAIRPERGSREWY